jgi:hypothetical protein
MTSILEQAGSQPQKSPKYVPIFIDRAFTGLFTQRAALHDPADIITTKYYGGRQDALWMGSNVELTNRLTLQRRPGLSPFSTATYPTTPNRAYSFQLIDGTIRVVIDTGSTGSLSLTSVDAPSGGMAVYHGTFPCGAANAFVGLEFLIAGFTNGPNNGTFLCVGSTATTLTLENGNAISETNPATAISAGAVYWDQQTGGLKTLLFAKSPGAGQTYFQGSGGILYMGDGVDVRKWTPLNTNFPPGSTVSVWNWGIQAPATQPTVTSVASGAAATVWQANTIFSTMGLTVDQFGQIWQLIGVNADGTNSANAQFGTAGNGNPQWNQALYGQTPETAGTPITWQNLGQLQPWAPHTQYGDAGTNGTPAPVGIFDPVTTSIYFNFRNSGGLGTSGATKPAFNGVAGSSFFDGGLHWFFIGKYTDMQPWKASHAYLHWYAGAGTRANILDPKSLAIEPFLFPPPTNTPIYIQVPTNTGTSGASYQPFPNATTVGTQQPDGQLLWLALGPGTWQANTNYVPWAVQGTPFGCVYDGTNMQVAVSGSRSGSVQPTFGANYGDHSTLDGDIIWVCVGPPVTWVAGSATTGIWNLPPSGFQPPQTSQAYGGSVIDSNTSLVEAAIVSGKSGTIQPTWGLIHTNTGDPGVALVLTSVAVAGPVTTYNGTITGGGANAFAGFVFLFAGFANNGNNGNFKIVSSTATTLVVTTTTQVNETRAATATTGLVWFAESVTTTNSLSWTKGLAYAYSFKARALDDFYSPPPLGGTNGVQNIPPGSTFGALGPPTGSETNAVSSASPAFLIVGANAGAVNTVTGLGSTDPQVDTIIIWRSADSASGAGQMFELTEIPAPKPIGGVAQPWTFQDFLPSTATNLFPGLNTLIPAPINDVNDPPFPTFLPMVYNFTRIWGADGEFVPFSGGPDTLVGNPDEAFAPADSLPFLAPVTRLVKTPQGLVTFLTDSIEIIAGGPLTSSFFSVTWAPGIGLLSFNALDVLAGEIYFFSSDNQFRIMTPSLNVSNAGFALGDQFANLPSSGVSDASWNPSNVYVASHQNGIDNCIFVADGATGWYRLNPRQAGAQPNTEPVWSPFASITGGCKMVESVETAPGIKKLLVGGTSCNKQILARDLTVYTDNGTPYGAFFILGSIMLCHPGQLALLKFCEFDFSGVSYQPTISYLLNEISGSFTPFTAPPQFDPPSLYGAVVTPTSYSPNRYYFLGNASLARCRHLQIKVDLGTTPVGNEMYNATIFGRIMIET